MWNKSNIFSKVSSGMPGYFNPFLLSTEPLLAQLLGRCYCTLVFLCLLPPSVTPLLCAPPIIFSIYTSVILLITDTCCFFCMGENTIHFLLLFLPLPPPLFYPNPLYSASLFDPLFPLCCFMLHKIWLFHTEKFKREKKNPGGYWGPRAIWKIIIWFICWSQ